MSGHLLPVFQDGLYLAIPVVGALLILLYPFHQQKKQAVTWVLSVMLVLAVVTLYHQWGGWQAWQDFQEQQVKAKLAKQLMKQYKTPTALIDSLRQKVLQHPNSAKGWYLLGRLYASQNEWHSAHQCFMKALRLQPEDEQYVVNDSYARWQLNQQRFNKNIRRALHRLLLKNPQQPDALALLAMDAYQQKHYRQAILYWQSLLRMTPPESEAALAIRKAIARAQKKSGHGSRY